MPTKPSTPKTTAKAGGTRPSAKPKLLSVVAEAGEPMAADDAMGSETAGKAGSGLRLKELVERVVAATGAKKKGVKDIVEATLTQLSEALQKGESLNLPVLGKMRVARAGSEGGGAMTLKLRRGTTGGTKAKVATDPIADADDQD